MSPRQLWSLFAVVALVCMLAPGCSPTPTKGPSGESASSPPGLLDGVYAVLPTDVNIVDYDSGASIVALATVPVPGTEAPSGQQLRVVDRPLVLFRETPRFEFTFEEGECTSIGFQNTDALRAHTREHLGEKLAVVIAGRVISEHKIREAIESAQVRITSCTVGGGDHLHAHLKDLKLASDSK